MFRSLGHRRRAAIGSALLAVTFIVAFATAASAHDVTGVSATCSTLTVHFHDFPNPGVPVHIVVQVGAAPVITQDDVVSAGTGDVGVDISAATAGLAGATAAVVVDVTWTNFGAQHVHDTTSVTCGTSTTSTMKATTSTTRSTTTTMPKTTTTSTTMAPTTTTSTTIAPVRGVQIFQVEFRYCRVLHVGYEHIPAGTVIRYRIWQARKLQDWGQFVTVGGKGFHFTSVKMKKHFSKHSTKGAVNFFWSVNGTPYKYTAIRNTGC